MASSNIALSWAPESFDLDLEFEAFKAKKREDSMNLSNLRALMNCGSSSTVAILQGGLGV